MLSSFIMHYLKDANDSLVVKDHHKYNLQSALRKTTPITYFVQKSRDPDFTTHKVLAIRPSCLSHLDISAPHFNVFHPKHIQTTGLQRQMKNLTRRHERFCPLILLKMLFGWEVAKSMYVRVYVQNLICKYILDSCG